MTTFKEVDALERQVLLALIEEEQFEVSDLIRKATPLDERIRKMNAYYARSRQQSGIYRATPAKVSPLRKLPYEVKNLQPGEPGYEQQQRQLGALWLAERRRNGYIEY